MKAVTQNEPLTDAEFDRLETFLKGCKGGRAMNVEQIDGFFAALIAGPEMVVPSEYWPEVFGGEMSETCEFPSLEDANDTLGLMMRHWNTIADSLLKGEVYIPLLLEDARGFVHGNDWAHGFMRGMDTCHDGWGVLVNDDDHGGCIVPMFMLHHEHNADPKMRPKPIDPAHREDIIAHMAVGLLQAYQYFRTRPLDTAEPRRNAQKAGRNDPCPCGSGKKYKRCCGRTTIQ